MTYEPCRYARRWPDLWASLPSVEERAVLSSTLASGRLEGMEPSRELVVDLVAQARGELSVPDAIARAVARARSESGS